MIANNEKSDFTRRYPDLPEKVLRRDSKIAGKIITAWDKEGNKEKVFKIFMKEKDILSHERYWELLKQVWIICGCNEKAPLFRKLMRVSRRGVHYFMTPEEHKKLRELPQPFLVYRAADTLNDGGLSWTTSQDYALNYSVQYNKKHVFTKMVHKEEVFAYIDRNGEDEIIIL